jgi:N-acetylated-alpha-linked acidic dipeptidase
LWKLIRAASRDVKDPKTGKSVYQQWQDRTREQQPEAEREATAEARISALGSGSDFTPFFQHLGVPSTDMGFGGDYGVYHSAYDSFYWMAHFGDPTFAYHVAVAQLWGTMAMRLAGADGLPLDYTDYANQIREFFKETVTLAKRRDLSASYDEKAMNAAIEDFAKEAAQVERNRQEALASIRDEGNESKLKRINDALIAAERAFTDPRGLRSRAWYKHEIYAPGIYTGYAAQPLTDFRQALDDRNTSNAKESLERIVEAIKRATEVLRRAHD